MYDLRHTFASHALQLVRGGYPITELDVAWLLGHTNALLVRKRYAHRLKYIPPRSEVLEFDGAHWTHLDFFHDRLMRQYERAGVTPVEQPATPTARVSG